MLEELATQLEAVKGRWQRRINTIKAKRPGLEDEVAKACAASNASIQPGPGTKQFPIKKFGKAIKQDGKISCVSWLDDTHLAVSCQDGKALVYNVKAPACPARWFYDSGKYMNTISVNQKTANTPKMLMGFGGLDNVITVVEFNHTSLLANEELPCDNTKKIFEKHGGAINCVEWISDSTFLSGSGDRTACLWDYNNPSGIVKDPIRQFEGHVGDVASIAIKDENTFITASGDKTLKIFDKRVFENTQERRNGVVATFVGHTRQVTKVKRFNNFPGFVSVSEDSTARVWDERTMTQMQCFGKAPNSDREVAEIHSMDMSPSGRFIFFGTNEGLIQALDLTTNEVSEFPHHHNEKVSTLALSPGSCALASASLEDDSKFNFAVWG